MSQSLILYQFKQEIKIDYINCLKVIQKNYTCQDKILEDANTLKEVLTNKGKINELDIPGPVARTIAMILAKNDNIEEQINEVSYWALFGKSKNDVSTLDSHISYLQTEDLIEVLDLYKKLNIANREDFYKYYSRLPQELKYSFCDFGEQESEEESFFKDTIELYNFYSECVKNKSWVCIDMD